MSFLEVAKKDLKIEFRTKNTINLMILFALITSIMFSIAIPIGVPEDVTPPLFSGLLWLVFLFVGMLGYGRAFLREVELETLEGLKLSPLTPNDILLGKIGYNLVVMLLMEAIVLPIFIGLFDLQIANPLMAIGAITLGNTGFVIVASSLSILVLNSQARELLLPIIMFPIIFPIISSTIQALSLSIQGTSFETIQPSIILIISFSIIMFIIALITSDYSFSE
ncbi:MAG: heme exporter protein CcmB [Archaeoglobaceae archaeon]